MYVIIDVSLCVNSIDCQFIVNAEHHFKVIIIINSQFSSLLLSALGYGLSVHSVFDAHRMRLWLITPVAMGIQECNDWRNLHGDKCVQPVAVISLFPLRSLPPPCCLFLAHCINAFLCALFAFACEFQFEPFGSAAVCACVYVCFSKVNITSFGFDFIIRPLCILPLSQLLYNKSD